jgi:hypothetical protein
MMKSNGETTNGDPDVIEENNCSKTEVARVSVRLPTFWAKRPASWFAQAEAQFHLAGITNERTQFYHIISQLDEKYVAEVDDINSPTRTLHHLEDGVGPTIMPI